MCSRIAVIAAALMTVSGATGMFGNEVQAEESEMLTAEQPVATSFSEPFARRHDQGGLVRLELGGAAVSGASFESRGVTVSGKAAMGRLPWSRVGLHVSGWGWGTDSRGALGAGPGVTFWFDETGGWYTSWSGGVAQIFGEHVEGAHIMLSGEGVFGLQGWVGDRWSMGAAAFFGGEAIPVYGDETEWSLNRARGGVRIVVTRN